MILLIVCGIAVTDNVMKGNSTVQYLAAIHSILDYPACAKIIPSSQILVEVDNMRKQNCTVLLPNGNSLNFELEHHPVS